VVPPTQFTDVNDEDITVIARSVCRMGEMLMKTGREMSMKPGPEGELLGATVGVIWRVTHVTCESRRVRNGSGCEILQAYSRILFALCRFTSNRDVQPFYCTMTDLRPF
jgi:hypothetical protein